MARLLLGLDFGTESARALLLRVDGSEAAEVVIPYAHGVLDRALPTGEPLGRDWALQHPHDWLETATHVTREALASAGGAATDVAGIGVDFTACTALPTTRDGRPLIDDAAWLREPHAWPKLWKHHATHDETAAINRAAVARGEDFLRYVGGIVGLEWLLPKAWQVLREAPEVYAAADRFIEAGDWFVWQLTGRETRNACAAGYKALWNRERGFPDAAFLAALDPALAGFHTDKVEAPIVAPGVAAGRVTKAAADRFGLATGTPVSAAVIDAHAGVPGAGVAQPGTMVLILGTSSCHLTMTERPAFFEGFAGLVEDGILPGLHGYESGQAAVGDIFAWFVEHHVPPAIHDAARAAGEDLHAHLSRLAASAAPGGSGLVALDWHQGNRSILMDGSLSGVLMGLTLQTRPEEIYRALIEATAFGTRRILDSYRDGGVSIDRIVACGGPARKNPLLVQIYADVTGRPIEIADSDQTVARGAAIFGALAAGAFPDAETAVQRLGAGRDRIVSPNPPHRAAYDELYEIYCALHDHFGRDVPAQMHRLREIAAR